MRGDLGLHAETLMRRVMTLRQDQSCFPVTAARSFGLVAALTAVTLVSACTSGEVGDVAVTTLTTPSVRESMPCAGTETDGADTATLSWQDVWPNAEGGGDALRVQDLRLCAASSDRTRVSMPRCAVGFPWRTADTANTDLAALGVVGVQLKHLVATPDAFVNETILSFEDPGSAGAKQLVKESIGCAQGEPPSQGSDANPTGWVRTQSGARLAVVESGSRLIAVEFADATLKQAQLQGIVNKAVDRSVNLG